MTAAEIQQRVGAWIDARSAWLGRDDARWSLASQWQAVSRQFGAGSPAALGVLLGLVRLAWADENLVAVRSCRGVGSTESGRCPPDAEKTASGGWIRMRWSVCQDSMCRPARGGWHKTEAEALIAALEAAP